MSSVARSQEQLALLVRAGEMFHRSLSVDETLANVARMAVESFAELCLFDLIDEHSGRLYVSAGAHRDISLNRFIKYAGSSLLYNTERGTHPAVRVAQTGETHFVPTMHEDEFERHSVSREHYAFMRRMRYGSKVVVPVEASGRIFGALTFVRTRGTDAFDSTDVLAAEELGRRAGTAIANAKQFHRERHVAATLQRAFLIQEFPNRERLTFHAFYRSGDRETELGGDWYDAFETREGDVIVTIGDVAGKGIDAARSMVQLRQAIRVASVMTNDPGEILSIANRTMLLDRTATFATAAVVTIDQRGDRLKYACAGHPPPFLVAQRGDIQPLSCGAPPLGVLADMTIESVSLEVDEHSLLVLYTDGVTEATRDAIAGEEQLLALLHTDALFHVANPARFLERAIGRAAARDDIAILTVTFDRSNRPWRLDVGDPTAAYTVKHELMRFIARASSASPGDLAGCELIVGELIGNAVRHAPGALSLSVSIEGEDLVLHAVDEGPGFERMPILPESLWAESGRGLFLIDRLSRGLDVERLPGYGSHIRVTLPLRATSMV